MFSPKLAQLWEDKAQNLPVYIDDEHMSHRKTKWQSLFSRLQSDARCLYEPASLNPS